MVDFEEVIEEVRFRCLRVDRMNNINVHININPTIKRSNRSNIITTSTINLSSSSSNVRAMSTPIAVVRLETKA